MRIDISKIFRNTFHLHPIPTGDLQILTNFQYDQLLVLLDFTSRKCANASKCFNGTCRRAVCELSVAPAYSYRFWPQTKRSFAPQLGLTNGPNNSPLPRTKSPASVAITSAGRIVKPQTSYKTESLRSGMF